MLLNLGRPLGIFLLLLHDQVWAWPLSERHPAHCRFQEFAEWMRRPPWSLQGKLATSFSTVTIKNLSHCILVIYIIHSQSVTQFGGRSTSGTLSGIREFKTKQLFTFSILILSQVYSRVLQRLEYEVITLIGNGMCLWIILKLTF